jgi:hypothetical protein
VPLQIVSPVRLVGTFWIAAGKGFVLAAVRRTQVGDEAAEVAVAAEVTAI